MDFNPISFSFFFFLLAPFILICYFLLSSLLQNDARGIFLLLGSFVNIALVYTVSYFVSEYDLFQNKDSAPGICNPYSVLNTQIDTVLPIGSSIIYYIYGYLIGCMSYASTSKRINDKTVFISNFSTHIFFTLLILTDIYWNYTQKCTGLPSQIVVLILSMLVGISLAYLFGASSEFNLFFTGSSNSERCHMNTKQKMTCTVKRNGRVITQTTG